MWHLFKILLKPLFCCYLQVDLRRSFTFRNSGHTYNGIPVMAANMDTVGTFEMAKSLGRVSKIQVVGMLLCDYTKTFKIRLGDA